LHLWNVGITVCVVTSNEEAAAMSPHITSAASITIRPAYADDHAALLRLAALDSTELPAGPLLLAEVDGELRAALSPASGVSIADPFFPTLHLVTLLRAHAGETAHPAKSRQRSYRLRFA
jgi:hypothetical protein